MTPKPSSPSAFRRLFALLSLSLTLAAFAADAKKNFDVPAGDALTTLKQAAQQGGVQIMFPATTVQGVQTKAVKGELATRDALDRMLDGSGLTVVQDEKTGAFAVRRETPEESKNAASRRADDRAPRTVIRDGALQMEKLEVVGQRDSGLVNEGVIPRDERKAIGYVVLGRAEIERTGATDINEVLRTLPQIASFEADTQSLLTQRGYATAAAGVTPASKIDIRGFGTQGTTILVNGRRMPLVRELQGGGPDISRIPLSAIERIEILPSSAGGIYGTYSMGGVINIILKKNFRGREFTISYGQATAGGANETAVTYTDGRSFFDGRANLTWTVDLRKLDPMYYRNRPLYETFLQKNPPPNLGGTIENWNSSGGFFNFPSVPAVVRHSTAGTALTDTGSTATVLYATVPTNQDDPNLTPASFLAGANKINPVAPYGDLMMFNPSKSASLNLTFNHELVKDRLTWYAEMGLGNKDVELQTPVTPYNLSLSATDVRNPFRTNVIPGHVGQAIVLSYLPSDLPGTYQHTVNTTIRNVLGLNGKFQMFGQDWKWAVDGSSDYNSRKAYSLNPNQAFNRIINAGSTNAVARAFYNPFADHVSKPNTAAAAALLNSYFSKNHDYVWLGSGVARLNGTLLDLPAGPLAVSALAEFDTQSYTNHIAAQFDMALLGSLGVTLPVAPPGAAQLNRNDKFISQRSTKTGGLEISVPLIGGKAKFLGLHRLELVAATSRSKLTDTDAFGSSNAGIRFAPIPDVTLRASYGTGTYPPQETYTRVPTTALYPSGDFYNDPRRGNTPIGPNAMLTSGGNPALLPEQTKTWNFGLILEPRQLKGLSVTFDYGFIEKIDPFEFWNGWIPQLLANEQYFASRIVRAAPTASDTALGWAGQIQALDLSYTNSGYIKTQYLDTSVRYLLETKSAGSFDFIWRSTNTRTFEKQLRKDIPVADTVDQLLSPLKFRGSGSVEWKYGNWAVTPSMSYIESYRDTLNVGVDNSLTTNLQVRYAFRGEGAGGRKLTRWLQGTDWILGVNNLFDNEPPYVYNGSGSFRSYISSYDDPRGRYVYLRIRKSF